MNLLLDGEKVRDIRINILRMTQKELAKAAKIGERTLQDIETNKREIRLATAKLLAVVLDHDLQLIIFKDEAYVRREIPIQIGQTNIRVVWEDLGNDCTVEQVVLKFKRLVESMPVGIDENISMNSGSVSSFHAELTMPKYAALLLQLFGKRNGSGEIIITDELLRSISELSAPLDVFDSEFRNVTVENGNETVINGPDSIEMLNQGVIFLKRQGKLVFFGSDPPSILQNGDVRFSGFSRVAIYGPARIRLNRSRFIDLIDFLDTVEMDSCGRITYACIDGSVVGQDALFAMPLA
jgi:transcriptional regulator with XRE-family HTH domain